MKALAVAHPMINDYGNGHTSDIGFNREENRELDYPYLWTDYVDTQYILTQNARGIAYKLYVVSVTIMDKYSPNIKNSQEVMSDTEGLMADMIQKISNDPALREYRIQMTTYRGQPVRDEEKEGAEGWTAPLAFKIPYEYCHSNLPFTS